jgi:prevent-host-death family protein
MRSVSIHELKDRTTQILRAVREKGEVIEVTYRGQVVARVIPVAPKRPPKNLRAVWSDMEQLATEIGARWPAGITAADAVSEVRREL